MNMESKSSPSFLRIVRIQSGLRQRDVADAIGRSPQFIHRLETHGPALLTPAIAEKIGAIVAVSPAELFGEAYRPGGSR